MAEKNQKEPTPPPRLLMSTGGLTLSPPDQPSVLMPVVQSESSLLDEDGEADSFVGQGPPPGVPTLGDNPTTKAGGLGSMSYFKGTSTGANDPFAQVGYIPPPQPLPPAFNLSKTTPNPSLPVSGASSLTANHPLSAGQGQEGLAVRASHSSDVDSDQPNKIWTPPMVEKPNTNIYRQKGPMRYAQPYPDTYGFSSTSAGAHPDPTALPPNSGLPPPPPSGFSPAPFMAPATSSTGPPPHGMYFPGTSGQPMGHPAAQQRGMMMGMYQGVHHHWCYRKVVEGVEVWYTFSRLDSSKLEEQFLKEKNGEAPEVVSTDGGRYDVEIGRRVRRSVYWEEHPFTIQRCSWFYKRERDNRYVPFDEATADFLEGEYKKAIENHDWHKRIELPGRDSVVMHNPNVIVHFQAASQPDEWGNVQTDQRPRVVKRGVDDFGTLEDGESAEVDHLVFVLHGIGETCHTQFRNIVECVDDFRSIANDLIKSHFGPYTESGHVHRVEFLPVYWHTALHSDTAGVDSRLKPITLPSAQKLRDFVNNTLMDILFYTSPAYCQKICDTVGREMNRLFQMFLSRNPTFSGEVSVAGHSLGASILFDLLLHQRDLGDAGNVDDFIRSENPSRSSDSPDKMLTLDKEPDKREEKATEPELTLAELLGKVGLKEKMSIFEQEQIDLDALSMCSEQDLKDLGLPMGPRRKLQLLLNDEKGKKEKKMRQELREEIRKEFEDKLKVNSKTPASSSTDTTQLHRRPSIAVNYVCGLEGTGQPLVHYHQLEFSPSCLFALGSPIGIFLSIRGVERMGENFKLPTCPRFLNVFHPFDPVAYRLEPLINSTSSAFKPVLVPHHKGRKRLHLELKDSLARMGSDLKQKIIESLRSTWNSLHDFARAHRSDSSRLQDNEEGLEKEVDQQVNSVMAHMVQQQDDKSDTASVCSSHDEDIPMGQLNEGRRVDYVLQEKPIESFNDYLFALASHTCYWTSEDTVLLILKEIYAPLGISPIMPGPDGRTPRLVMPPALGPPPKSSTPYPGASHPPSMPHMTSHPPPSGPSSGVPLVPPVPHMQGPLARLASPYGVGGSDSRGSSRSSTPPISGQGMPQTSRAGNAGPPPTAGFVRSQPLQ